MRFVSGILHQNFSLRSYYTGYTKQIREALTLGNMQAALRFAHTLKGTTGSIAAEPLYEASARLEQSLKAASDTADSSVGVRVEGVMEEVELCLERLITTLKQII